MGLPFSLRYMKPASANCLTLLRHLVCCALRFALESTGSNKAARIAMIAITTNSSTKVNPCFSLDRFCTEFIPSPSFFQFHCDHERRRNGHERDENGKMKKTI